MQEDSTSGINLIDLLLGVSEGGVKAVNFQPEENETLGFFNKSNKDDKLVAEEYEITRHKTGITDIRVRKDK